MQGGVVHMARYSAAGVGGGGGGRHARIDYSAASVEVRGMGSAGILERSQGESLPNEEGTSHSHKLLSP